MTTIKKRKKRFFYIYGYRILAVGYKMSMTYVHACFIDMIVDVTLMYHLRICPTAAAGDS